MFPDTVKSSTYNVLRFLEICPGKVPPVSSQDNWKIIGNILYIQVDDSSPGANLLGILLRGQIFCHRYLPWVLIVVTMGTKLPEITTVLQSNCFWDVITISYSL